MFRVTGRRAQVAVLTVVSETVSQPAKGGAGHVCRGFTRATRRAVSITCFVSMFLSMILQSGQVVSQRWPGTGGDRELVSYADSQAPPEPPNPKPPLNLGFNSRGA